MKNYELIDKDEYLLEKVKRELGIVDSEIVRFNIFLQQWAPVIEIDFKIVDSPKDIRLKFLGIGEYSFYFNKDYSFYNVESMKIGKTEDWYFISFDPEDEMLNELSDNDQDFIVFKSFEGYYIDSIPKSGYESI